MSMLAATCLTIGNSRSRSLLIITYLLFIFGQKLSTSEEILILAEGDDWLRQLSKVELQQGSHSVDISVTTNGYSVSHDRSFILVK